MKDEIVAGLKNALDRGESLKSAVQSFINAGYNPVQVREAAKALSEGASQITGQSEIDAPQRKQGKREPPPLPKPAPAQKKDIENADKGKKILLIGLIIIISLLILGGIGFLIYYLLS